MALDQAWASGDAVTKARAKTFIPEIWSDEIISEYEHSLVMKPLIKSLKMAGKKGDTIHIPMPLRSDPNEKVAEKQVTLIANTEEEKVIVVDQHWEYSKLIEDIVDVQALSSLRRFYTQDAGYALARKVDSDIIATAIAEFTNQIDSLGGNPGSSASPHVAGNAKEFCDQAFRDAIQLLDDADVPMDSRKLVIPPAARNQIMGIDRYVSSDFVNGRGVVNGKIGELYGVDIYVSTNLPANQAGEKPCLLFHTDALVIAEQMGVRVQTQYKQEYLADLMTADTLYGEDVYREDNGVVIWVSN
jgi:N4-gp56 family major capsid protein